MTTNSPLTHADERFALGVRGGFSPTVDAVSDSNVTPFGLTMRSFPAPRNAVLMRTADGSPTMANTEAVTTMSTDGSDEGDMRADIIKD